MKRRAILSGIGTLAVGGLAGCVTDGGTGDEPTEQRPRDGSESPPSTGDPPALAETSLEPKDGGCGQQKDEAEISFDGEAPAVVVNGTIWGSDMTKMPALADASYDAGADELTVTVTTKQIEGEGADAGGQCITELDYRVTASFDGGLPGSVRVVHDHGDGGTEVATKSRT